MAITAPPDPSVGSKAYTFMRDRLRILNATYAGTAGIQALREEVLAMYVKEEPENYNKRVRSTRLKRNMFRQAVDRITGRIFQVPLKIVEPLGRGEEIAEDFDLKGNNIDRVGRTLYHSALKLGLYGLLVEYPVVNAQNLLQERQANARPYAVLLDPTDIIRAYWDEKGHCTHVAWATVDLAWDETKREEITVERVHERYRRVDGVEAITWIQTPQKAWVPDPTQPPRTIKVPGADPSKIMFHVFYAEREGPMVGRTPLTEVADLTLIHFGINAEYLNALRKNLFPVLTAVGMDQDKIGNIAFTPETVLGSTNKDAKFSMLEHSGTALESGFKELESLEQRAEAYAGRLTRPSGDATATSAAIGTAEVSSFAKDMALTLQSMLQEVLDDMATWLGTESLGEVQINLDFAVDFGDGDMQALTGMRTSGDISRQTLWRESRRRNVLGADFDEDEEAKLLEEEQAEAMEREKAAMETAHAMALETEETKAKARGSAAPPRGGAPVKGQPPVA